MQRLPFSNLDQILIPWNFAGLLASCAKDCADHNEKNWNNFAGSAVILGILTPHLLPVKTRLQESLCNGYFNWDDVKAETMDWNMDSIGYGKPGLNLVGTWPQCDRPQAQKSTKKISTCFVFFNEKGWLVCMMMYWALGFQRHSLVNQIRENMHFCTVSSRTFCLAIAEWTRKVHRASEVYEGQNFFLNTGCGSWR